MTMTLRRAAAAVLVALGCSASPPAGAPRVSGRAPDFTLNDSDGQSVTLSKLLEKGPVILAFFPKAFTGG